MHNLRRMTGTMKGLIGELMFKSTDKLVYINRFNYKIPTIKKLEQYLTEKQRIFLKKNWYSIDGIKEFRKKIILYEIKIRNKYYSDFSLKPTATQHSHEIYESAKKLGFQVKLVIVYLSDNWNFDIEIFDYDESLLYIDRRSKPYYETY